jgi:hypothetical protein
MIKTKTSPNFNSQKIHKKLIQYCLNNIGFEASSLSPSRINLMITLTLGAQRRKSARGFTPSMLLLELDILKID